MQELKRSALTPAQQKAWGDTRTALMWHCPAFTHILLTMLNKQGNEHQAVMTTDVPIAATDGDALIINPDEFFKFNLYERLFITAHEICHCILNHCVLMHGWKAKKKVMYPDGRSLPYVHEYMNMAMDYVINDMLVASGIGKVPQRDGKPCVLHDRTIGQANESVVDVYRKVYEANPPKFVFDTILAPGASQGKDPHQAVNDRNETEWQTQIAAAARVQEATMGKMPAGLSRFFQDALDPKVDWREQIQTLFARKLGSGSYDFKKPDRRLIVRDIYAPGKSGFGAGTIVMAADTSGSIGAKELDMFFAEIAGLLEDLKPQRLVILWCDAHVHRVDECDEPSDLNVIRADKNGVGGGGGTSFVPVFDWIEKEGITPDALVYLTDGMGTFPSHEPKYHVIWGSIYEASKYPFGDVVNIPKQAA